MLEEFEGGSAGGLEGLVEGCERVGGKEVKKEEEQERMEIK